MVNNTVSTGQLSYAGKSNSVEVSSGSSGTVQRKPAAGSARQPQNIEDVPGDPASESERADTGGDAAVSTAEAMDPVNMATGEYIYEDKDFILPDMGGEYSLVRRYTGPVKKKPDRSLGKAWAFSTDTFVTEGEKEAVVTMPDGKTAEYIKCGSRYINKKSGTEKHMLRKTKSGYIFTDSTNRIKYYYDENGKIEKKADRNGNATQYIYNEYGIEKVILPTGYYITFMRENMKISSATDSTGRMVRYEYDKGLLTKVIRCDGTEIKYTYDEKENLKAVTDGMGCTYLENRYDDIHRVIWQKTADGRYCTCTYDEKNRTNTVTEEENGAVTQYQYDKNHDIICIKYLDGSEEKRKTDKYGNITEETDRCGAVTSYKYDKKGNLLIKKEPSGLITRYEYNISEYGNSLLAKRWDNAGRQAIYSYDPNGNITEERRLLNDSGEESVTEYKYDSYGRMEQKNENGRITTYKYDGAFPYPTQITLPDGTETKKIYDAAGRLSKKIAGDITEKYTYTDYNKIETYTNGEGGVTEYKYDRGWRAVEIIRSGQERGEKYGYDCMDRLISEEDACGRKTIYKRNAYGDIIQIIKCGTEENLESITYEYDSCHRVIRKNVGTYGFESYEYDNCGRTIRKTLAENGRQEENNRGYEYIRDIAGRITMEKDPYGNITNAYCYDLCGNVKKHIHSPSVLRVMVENGGTAEDGIYPGDIYSYGRTGLMTSKKELLAITKEGKALYGISIYKYDKDGNLITEKSYAEPQDGNGEPQGRTRITERKYDRCGRLEEISDSEGAKAVYEYDMHGRKIKETEIQDSEKSRITEYGYDRCGRLTSEKIKEKKTQESQHREKLERRNGNRFLEVRKTLQKEIETQEKLIEEIKYAYDKSGNIAKAVLPDGLTIIYSYDASGRRTAITASDAKNRETVRKSIYKYDEYGYLSEKTENGITTKYENDAFGNIKKEIHADGGITTYNYGLNGKCINIIRPEENRKSGESPASSTQAGTVMEYDLCGRLIKTTDSAGNTAAENTYDTNGNLLMQANADGNTIKYAYDAGGRLKYSLTAAGVRKEYTYNAYGDITAQSLGKEVVYYKTDIWGHILEIKTAEGIKETYEYDYMGNLTAAIDGEGRRSEYHRDICGNTDRIIYADRSMEAFTYDEAGRPASKTYRSGKIETYTYDVFGNPLKIQAEEKLAPEDMEGNRGGCGENEVYTYEYDKNGRVKSAAGGGIKYTYGYDLCGRPESKSACGRTLIKYGYDLNGNITSVTDVTGKTTFYEYDIADRLSTISENGKILAKYTYTPCGKVSEIKCGDIKTEYRYDPDGKKAGIKVTAGINTISDIKYIYDESGN